LEVLDKPEFYAGVTEISFSYVRFDFLTHSTNLNSLKSFSSLKSLVLDTNNITSFLQVAKLESLSGLRKLVITSNDLSHTELLKLFVIYRFPRLTEFNREEVTEFDKYSAL
jgi:hypothetical protein